MPSEFTTLSLRNVEWRYKHWQIFTALGINVAAYFAYLRFDFLISTFTECTVCDPMHFVSQIFSELSGLVEISPDVVRLVLADYSEFVNSIKIPSLNEIRKTNIE
jgi:hypothetical protein